MNKVVNTENNNTLWEQPTDQKTADLRFYIYVLFNTVFQSYQADEKMIHVTKCCEQLNPGIGWKGLRFQEGSNHDC